MGETAGGGVGDLEGEAVDGDAGTERRRGRGRRGWSWEVMKVELQHQISKK
ncbi:hypothetical protein QJS10_CPA10g01770 [Acorus calamus]|uniref:Uncharacterized protein n=1 Tax=Acorus calamus TaxID=4465 RepID=A0AAV9E0H3_ACOCL|nr:hypothetical protein QJS10_CPA10g01770 [Acorus calamus]